MLTILLNWIYILFTIFCLGYAFCRFVKRVLHYDICRMDSVLIVGLVSAAVYAQIFSLFSRVSVEANVCLLLACIVIVVIWKKQMWAFLRSAFSSCSLVRKLLILLLFLVWGYFSSRGYFTYDADLYYGQAIRWIEEYGVVKGLGNLHTRFAYNSSVLVLSALYSMKFLVGRSLHGVTGLIAFILSAGLLDLGGCFRRKKMLLSDFGRVCAVYYLTMIWDEILAPSSDYAVMCMIFFLVIRWLTFLENKEDRENITPYALLCVLAAYAVTVKLSAGLILLLVLKPAVRLLREKRWKEIFIYLALGLLVSAPWMVREVIISGWLLYPFSALDLFSVDWKMSVGDVNTDAALIKVWAKAANHIGIDVTLQQWFPNWFLTTLSKTEKLLVVGDLTACVITVALWIRTLVFREWKRLDVLLVITTMMSSYLFWQLSAPMPRYGYAYILLLAALTAGYLLRGKVAGMVYLFLIVFGLYKLYIGCQYIASCSKQSYYVWQLTYGTYEVYSYEIDGFTFYASPYQGRTGYDPFPASSTPADQIQLRGDSLSDGFRLKQDMDQN